MINYEEFSKAGRYCYFVVLLAAMSTPDVFYVHCLLERAAKMNDAIGVGSITARYWNSGCDRLPVKLESKKKIEMG